MSLTRQQAELRSNCFDLQSYIQNTVYVELSKGKRYQGLIKAEFKLLKKDPQLFIDYQGEPIKQLELNGVKFTSDAVQKDKKIALPEESQKEGENQLIIHFENEYSTSGHGLHSFVDTDGAQYVYSQCEPYHASKMFPCFDQPDLKGTFKLFTQAPKDWIVISNERRVDFSQNVLPVVNEYGLFKQNNDYDLWEFLQTKPLSTYLYAILGGPYSEIRCPENELHNGVPMSIFCRTSLLKHVQKDEKEIFSMTTDGMVVYEKLFGIAYPFSKYDQIFCPEYSSGAMENAGAVTINDVYVFKEEVPVSQRADRANTILHELSHMWFGDLVTMKWWDDLWLNESFAEFISHLAQWKIQSKELQGVDFWVQFYERKIWGQITDQLSTTHPIFCVIENTDQADNIFDGITYAKGAALLKQLYFMMGEETFTKAMTKYFHTFQYKNTTLNDFFGVMQWAFQEQNTQWDLNKWREEWIMKAGLNSIETSIVDGKLQVIQKPTRNDHATLREHTFKVAIYNPQGALKSVETVQIQNQEVNTVPLAINGDEYFLINYNDESYIKAIYTPEQAKFFMQNLSKVEPSLSRALILRSIWDQVRDGQICFLTFIDGVLNNLLNETNDTVSKMVLSWCLGGSNFYTPRPLRNGLRSQLANVVFKMIETTDPNNKNKLLVLKRYLVRWAKSQEFLTQLTPYVNNFQDNQQQLGYIGLDNGWSILHNIFAYDQTLTLQQKWQLFEAWAQHDGSDEVQKHKRYLTVLTQSDPNERAKFWDYFLNFNKEESVQMVEQAMSAFNHDIYETNLQPYELQYFAALPQIFANKEAEYAKAFYDYLYPIGDNIDLYTQQCQELLSSGLKNDSLIRKLKESLDQDQRRSKTYATFPKQQ